MVLYIALYEVLCLLRYLNSLGIRVAQSVLSDYGLVKWGLITGRGKGFSSSLCAPTGSEAHLASYPVDAEGPCPQG
jgi:hypothetical protein